MSTKRQEIANKVSAFSGGKIPNTSALGVLYVLEQLNFQVVPTDETLEYYGLSKEEAEELRKSNEGSGR